MSKIGQAAGVRLPAVPPSGPGSPAPATSRRDPMALLQLRPGRDDPYAIYDQIRAEPARSCRPGSATGPAQPPGLQPGAARPPVRGPADRGRAQPVATTRTCRSWSMNPPDHTRLRRLAQPAFSPKAVATYRDRIEQTVGRPARPGRVGGRVRPGLRVRRAAADRGDHRPARHPGRGRRGVRPVRARRSAARWTASGRCATRRSCRPATPSCESCSTACSSCAAASPPTTSSATWWPPRATRSSRPR